MHVVHRYQTLSVNMPANAEAQSAVAPEVLPPVAPPVNLPQEWPLARLSVQLRHIGVLLRVTLYRRLAELSFRGVAFCQLPREVMKDICQDFDNVCGEMANRLASLFAFLKPTSANAKHSDPMGQSLYADPGFWLYGLLSFCAKACETKTAEANGAPAFRAKEERATPALEPNSKTLSLMQTVVMSFGRNQNLGRPDLPIHHVHVYFPVQLVHKLIERMKVLHFQDVTPVEGKRYRHNSESEANSPYIIVGTYDGVCTPNSFSALPHTPKVAGAYEYGILDGNFGQMVSFQSTYKSTLRIEVPAWPDVQHGVLATKKAMSSPDSPGTTIIDSAVERNTQMAMPVPATHEETLETPKATADPECDEEEVEDDTYVPPEGEGCFSFRQSLLLRAKDTYSARSIGNKYEIISKSGSSRDWQWFSLGPTGISSPKNARLRPLPKIYSGPTTNGDTRLTSWIKRGCRTLSPSRTPSPLQSGSTSSRGLVTRVMFRIRMMSTQHARGRELKFFTQQLIKQTP